MRGHSRFQEPEYVLSADFQGIRREAAMVRCESPLGLDTCCHAGKHDSIRHRRLLRALRPALQPLGNRGKLQIGRKATIQWLKYTARGFRNPERFRTAIYFHLGGLDVYPKGLLPSSPTHTNA